MGGLYHSLAFSPTVNASTLRILVAENSFLLIIDRVLIFASAHQTFKVAEFTLHAKGF